MSDPLTYHLDKSVDWFDAQYNLRLSRPDFEETVTPGWNRRSLAARRELSARCDITYGPGERQKLDVFHCGDPMAPTLVYIHGGYWKHGDKSLYSFVATPFVGAGVNVVVVGYDLCPQVTLTRIAQEMREAMAYLFRSAGDLGINPVRISVMGHSAGGHLTLMMMGTDWQAVAPDLPADLVKAGIPISPLSLLDPVRRTVALNADIRMDAAEAEALSPMLTHPPLTDAPQLVVVGGVETSEFHRQGEMYVDAFGSDTRRVDFCVVPNADHFDALNVLTDPGSEVFGRINEILVAT